MTKVTAHPRAPSSQVSERLDRRRRRRPVLGPGQGPGAEDERAARDRVGVLGAVQELRAAGRAGGPELKRGRVVVVVEADVGQPCEGAVGAEPQRERQRALLVRGRKARLGTGAEIEAAELVVAADAGAIRAAADVGEERADEVEVGDAVPPGADLVADEAELAAAAVQARAGEVVVALVPPGCCPAVSNGRRSVAAPRRSSIRRRERRFPRQRSPGGLRSAARPVEGRRAMGRGRRPFPGSLRSGSGRSTDVRRQARGRDRLLPG